MTVDERLARSQQVDWLTARQRPDDSSDYARAAKAAATNKSHLKRFRTWGQYTDTPELRAEFARDSDLWVPRVLSEAWSKQAECLDCYQRFFTKARFWPRLKQNWEESAAFRLDLIGEPFLIESTYEGEAMPAMSAEIAGHLMLLTFVEELLYGRKGTVDLRHYWYNETYSAIAEVGGGFGAMAIMAIDLFDDLGSYTIVDIPQVLALVYVLASLTLPHEKIVKLNVVDATSSDAEASLDNVPVELFFSSSAYSELHPLIRRRYYETLVQRAPLGLIIDNSYTQWQRGMFDLGGGDSGGVGGWMNSLDNATLETNASDIYGKGVDSRHSLPVRGLVERFDIEPFSDFSAK